MDFIMMLTTMSEIETFVNGGKFKDAIQLCESAITLGQNVEFWKTQLAYVCFLNEDNDEARYVTAHNLFISLTELNPLDANSHFWLGYITDIFFNNKESARSHLLEVKLIAPKFFYADLALAGLVENHPDNLEYLEAVLQQKPNLYRALLQMSELLIKAHQYDNARRTLNALLNSDPYLETEFGVMNKYMNDVFTCATHQEDFQNKCEAMLKDLSSRTQIEPL